jgi:hypothetical protein
MSRAEYLRWLKKHNPAKYNSLMRKYGGGGGTGVRRVHVKLPPVKWQGLNGALSRARSRNKPVLLVFATEKLKSAATFNRAGSPAQVAEVRKQLGKSGAIPVKVLPPKPPKTVRGMSADEIKLARKAYREACRKYRETARKYGASMYPTVVFLAPGGDVLGRVFNPSARTLHASLKALPAAVRAHREKKAREAAAKAKKEAEAEAEKKSQEAAKQAKKTGAA